MSLSGSVDSSALKPTWLQIRAGLGSTPSTAFGGLPLPDGRGLTSTVPVAVEDLLPWSTTRTVTG
jgi:hypothetical protein